MTRDECLAECVQLLEQLKDSVANHPLAGRIADVTARAKAIELEQEAPEPTGTIKKILGDRRAEIRDPGEHDQHIAEEFGFVEKSERLRQLEAQAMDAMSAINRAECILKHVIEEIRSLKHRAS